MSVKIQLRAAGRHGWLLLAALMFSGPPISAQLSYPPNIRPLVRADLFTRSVERWRGISRNAHWTAQGDAAVGLAAGDFSVLGGIWGSGDFWSTRREPRSDLRAGGPGLTEWSLWAQVAMAKGPAQLSVGVLRNGYVRETSDPAVVDLYGLLQLRGGRWAGSLLFSTAIDGAEGTYFEPAISYHHLVLPLAGPAVSLVSSLRSGVQVGRRNPIASSVPGPRGEGLTHVALGTNLRIAFPLTPAIALFLSVNPEAQYGRDVATRLWRDGTRGSALRFWVPVQAGVSWPLRRPQ